MKFFYREKTGGKTRLFSCTGEGKTFEYGWSIGLREGSESGVEGWRGGKKPQALALTGQLEVLRCLAQTAPQAQVSSQLSASSLLP